MQKNHFVKIFLQNGIDKYYIVVYNYRIVKKTTISPQRGGEEERTMEQANKANLPEECCNAIEEMVGKNFEAPKDDVELMFPELPDRYRCLTGEAITAETVTGNHLASSADCKRPLSERLARYAADIAAQAPEPVSRHPRSRTDDKAPRGY